MRYDALSMNFRNITNTKDTISCVFILTNSLNKNNYLNFAKTQPSVSQSRVSEGMGWDGVKISEQRTASKQASKARKTLQGASAHTHTR